MYTTVENAIEMTENKCIEKILNERLSYDNVGQTIKEETSQDITGKV